MKVNIYWKEIKCTHIPLLLKIISGCLNMSIAMNVVTPLHVLLSGGVIKGAAKDPNSSISTLVEGRERGSMHHVCSFFCSLSENSDNWLWVTKQQAPCFCERSFHNKLQGRKGREHFRLSLGCKKRPCCCQQPILVHPSTMVSLCVGLAAAAHLMPTLVSPEGYLDC